MKMHSHVYLAVKDSVGKSFDFPFERPSSISHLILIVPGRPSLYTVMTSLLPPRPLLPCQGCPMAESP